MFNSVRSFIPAKRLVPLVFVADAAVRAECSAQHPQKRWRTWWPLENDQELFCNKTQRRIWASTSAIALWMAVPIVRLVVSSKSASSA